MTTPEETSWAAFHDAFAQHRADLLRHCYRMLGTFADAEDQVQQVLLEAWRARASYAADAPLLHWLMRIATNECLNALARRRRLGLPQIDVAPAAVGTPIEEREATSWVTPGPDARLFSNPERVAEEREEVALAFLALLQRLPPRQRAALLLKDVLGWSAEEIAATLDTTVASVNSALHRARETIADRPREIGQEATEEPSPELLQAYVRSWEAGDLDTLVALLRKDVVFAMPPHATWFRGAEAMRLFLQTPRFAAFWAGGLRALLTRANGLPALAWYTLRADGVHRLHSIHVVRFVAGQVAEATNFIGPHYLHGFDLPESFP